jgi:hypothetical protein
MRKIDSIAIDLFKMHKDKLKDLNVNNRQVFGNTLKDYIKQYIDPNSEHLKSFSGNGIFWSYNNFLDDKESVEQIINDCIITIEKAGIYKNPTLGKNFLSNFDNNTLWTILAFFVVILSTGSFYVGKYHERSELLFNKVSTNSNSISTTDTTSNYKNNIIRQKTIKQKVDSISNNK